MVKEICRLLITEESASILNDYTCQNRVMLSQPLILEGVGSRNGEETGLFTKDDVDDFRVRGISESKFVPDY